MNLLLLTGAGFSRNWGGWLADEAFEYLLGWPGLSPAIRDLLWKKKNSGGFEEALAVAQRRAVERGKASNEAHDLAAFEEAVVSMFAQMNRGMASQRFEFQNLGRFRIAQFLPRFDQIFTLNQDALLEHHYLNDNVSLLSQQKWTGWTLPGMKPIANGNADWVAPMGEWEPLPEGLKFGKHLQPYIKLHGSANWRNGDDELPLLVVGGNKEAAIGKHAVLQRYYEHFCRSLLQEDTRLMVMGYGFRDEHINRAIEVAAEKGHLRLFIVDPRGTDVLDRLDPRAQIRAPDPLYETLKPFILGASRRSLREIFGGDHVEYEKVLRFLIH